MPRLWRKYLLNMTKNLRFWALVFLMSCCSVLLAMSLLSNQEFLTKILPHNGQIFHSDILIYSDEGQFDAQTDDFFAKNFQEVCKKRTAPVIIQYDDLNFPTLRLGELVSLSSECVDRPAFMNDERENSSIATSFQVIGAQTSLTLSKELERSGGFFRIGEQQILAITSERIGIGRLDIKRAKMPSVLVNDTDFDRIISDIFPKPNVREELYLSHKTQERFEDNQLMIKQAFVQKNWQIINIQEAKNQFLPWVDMVQAWQSLLLLGFFVMNTVLWLLIFQYIEKQASALRASLNLIGADEKLFIGFMIATQLLFALMVFILTSLVMFGLQTSGMSSGLGLQNLEFSKFTAINAVIMLFPILLSWVAQLLSNRTEFGFHWHLGYALITLILLTIFLSYQEFARDYSRVLVMSLVLSIVLAAWVYVWQVFTFPKSYFGMPSRLIARNPQLIWRFSFLVVVAFFYIFLSLAALSILALENIEKSENAQIGTKNLFTHRLSDLQTGQFETVAEIIANYGGKVSEPYFSVSGQLRSIDGEPLPIDDFRAFRMARLDIEIPLIKEDKDNSPPRFLGRDWSVVHDSEFLLALDAQLADALNIAIGDNVKIDFLDAQIDAELAYLVQPNLENTYSRRKIWLRDHSFFNDRKREYLEFFIAEEQEPSLFAELAARCPNCLISDIRTLPQQLKSAMRALRLEMEDNVRFFAILAMIQMLALFVILKISQKSLLFMKNIGFHNIKIVLISGLHMAISLCAYIIGVLILLRIFSSSMLANTFFLSTQSTLGAFMVEIFYFSLTLFAVLFIKILIDVRFSVENNNQ